MAFMSGSLVRISSYGRRSQIQLAEKPVPTGVFEEGGSN